MCLQWMWFNRRKARASRSETGRETGDTESSTVGPSGLLSSTTLSSEFISSSSSSLSVSLVKEILPQRPLLYNHTEIALATRNFDSSQKIGSSAWKGKLRGAVVAIVQKPGQAKNFNKLLRHVHALHHSSLIKVLGGCMTTQSVFIVYEFVHGIDLQSCLCSTLSPGYTVLSTWKLRMQVAVDVAKGLEYVHQHTSLQSAHKYLTSSNIMLTNESCRAKLALVGMSILTGEVSFRKLVSDHEVGKSLDQQGVDAGEQKKRLASSDSIKIKGARGYMPPEYACFGTLSQKYDVFTYGIVLLELLKGAGVNPEETLMPRKASIVDEVRSMFSDETADRGMLRLWIDRRLQDSYPVDDALKVVRLALSCVDEDPHKRPTMRDVALHMVIFFNLAEVWERGRRTFTGTATLAGR